MSTTTISHDAQMNDLHDMLFCGGGEESIIIREAACRDD